MSEDFLLPEHWRRGLTLGLSIASAAMMAGGTGASLSFCSVDPEIGILSITGPLPLQGLRAAVAFVWLSLESGIVRLSIALKSVLVVGLLGVCCWPGARAIQPCVWGRLLCYV